MSTKMGVDLPVRMVSPRCPRGWHSAVRVGAAHALWLVALLAAWETAVARDIISSLILPPPSEILGRLAGYVLVLVRGGYLLEHFYVTVLEVGAGFLVSLVLGVGLGTLISEVPAARRLIYPYVVAFNAMPRVAFAPLFLIWFGFGIGSRVAMVIAVATFPVVVSAITGLRATDPSALRLMRSLGASGRETFWKVRFPSALPYLFAGIETASVLAVIGAIVGEFAGGSSGLGYVITVAQEQLATPEAFALIILLSTVGVLIHQAVVAIRRRVVFWQGRDQQVTRS